MSYVFGIDAGGTKTACAIGDAAGSLLAVGEGGPANYKLVGPDVARRNILQAIEQARAKANIGAVAFDYGFYAVSGLDVVEDRNTIDGFIREINPAKQYGLDNDAIASLVLGTSAGTGVVIICGTGSNCVAVKDKSERLQVGGLGREFGDFCGGREIAIQAMAAAVRGFDGRGPKTILYDSITEYLGVESLADFTPILHHSARSYPIANLVPLVFQAAEKGDQVAIDILKYNGEELGLLAKVAIDRLFKDAHSVEVVLTGGVFKSDVNGILLDSLKSKLGASYQNVEYKIPEGDPVIGSLIQAFRMGGIEVSPEHREELIAQYYRLLGSVKGAVV